MRLTAALALHELPHAPGLEAPLRARESTDGDGSAQSANGTDPKDVSADLKRSRETGRARGRGGRAVASARATPVAVVPCRRGSYPRTPSPPRSRRPRAAPPWRLRKRTSRGKGAVAVAFGDAEETSKPKRAGDDARGGTRRRAFACARECARAASSARARHGLRARCAAAFRARRARQTVQFEFFCVRAIVLIASRWSSSRVRISRNKV